MKAGLQGPHAVFRLGVPGKRDEKDLVLSEKLPQAERHGIAVHPGQAHVDQGNVRLSGHGLLDPGRPVLRDDDVVPPDLEETAQPFAGVAVVLDDQHARSGPVPVVARRRHGGRASRDCPARPARGARSGSPRRRAPRDRAVSRCGAEIRRPASECGRLPGRRPRSPRPASGRRPPARAGGSAERASSRPPLPSRCR